MVLCYLEGWSTETAARHLGCARGTVCSLKGAWLHTSDNGQTISALCPAHHADVAEGACFNDARVEVAAF